MKQRGAGRVLGVDIDDRYLNQARFAARPWGWRSSLRSAPCMDVDRLAGSSIT